MAYRFESCTGHQLKENIMTFEEIECTYAFYDDYSSEIFYAFRTVPQIGHGEWAISAGGDTAYDMSNDNITQEDFPIELLQLLGHIPDEIEVDGLEE